MFELIPILLMEIGASQIFHYGEYEDLAPIKVYWQCPKIPICFGPFQTLTEAMDHLSKYTMSRRTGSIMPFARISHIREEIIPSNVVKVDFILKRRL